MAWTPYSGAIASIPILAGGLIWTAGGYATSGTGEIYVGTMTTTGTVGGASTTLADGPQSMSNLMTDGTNVYVAYRDIYPRSWLSYWDIATVTFNANQHNYLQNFEGLVLTPGDTAVATGGDHGGSPEANYYALPNTDTNQVDFAPTSGIFGFAVFDGTYVWSPILNSDQLAALDPSTLAIAYYTMPDSVSSNTTQIGFDGTNLYISMEHGGILVWDVSTASGSVSGSTITTHCWYSTNLNLVFVSDEAGGGSNIYVMTPGGGSLTNIGNATTITGTTGSAEVNGFCDGPGTNDVWANMEDGSTAWNVQYKPGASMQLVMMP
jgi:hypothetical protein